MNRNFSFFSFIFIGDTHGFINDFIKQKEIIEKVKPDFVLSEQMQEMRLDSVEVYKSVLNNKFISDTVKFEDVSNLITLCFQNRIKLIGIDLENFGFDERLQKVVKGEIKPNKEDEGKLENILEKRSKHHLSVLKKYTALTTKPIVVILGSWHLRDGSPLMEDLDNYIVFYPSDDMGNILLAPPENPSIVKYGVRMKGGKKD